MTRVVVVGGGIVGCATAYFLAREGAQVSLVEREHVAYGASGRNPGFVWLHARNPGLALELALATRQLYVDLLPELDPFEFRESGGIIFFLTPEQGQVVGEFVEARNQDGLEMELIDGPEVRRLVPPIRDDVLGASYCPLDAHINTPLFVRALAEGARRHGAEVLEGQGVEEVAPGRVRTAERTLEADEVVVAAGVWTRELLEPIGVHAPLGAERLQVVSTAPIDARIEPVVYGPVAAKQYDLFRDLPSYDDSYFVADYEDVSSGVEMLELVAQRQDGSVLLGCPMDYPPTLDMRPTLDGLAMTALAIGEDFPGLRRAPVDRVWAGLLPFTSDTLPVVDRLEPGLWIAAGHVYGNAAGPITGRLLATLVMRGSAEIDLSPCRLDRDLRPVAHGVATRW